MEQSNISVTEMAQFLGIKRETMSRKLHGKQPILLHEAFKIKIKYFPDILIEFLFREIFEGEKSKVR